MKRRLTPAIKNPIRPTFIGINTQCLSFTIVFSARGISFQGLASHLFDINTFFTLLSPIICVTSLQPRPDLSVFIKCIHMGTPFLNESSAYKISALFFFMHCMHLRDNLLASFTLIYSSKIIVCDFVRVS